MSEKVYKMIECNQNECETWVWLFAAKDYEISELEKYIKNAQNVHGIEISKETLTVRDAKLLAKHAVDDGYYPSHNWCGWLKSLPDESYVNGLYKGDIRAFCEE